MIPNVNVGHDLSHKRMLAVAVALCFIFGFVLVYEFVYFPLWKVNDASLAELCSRPRDFDGFHVRLLGYIARTGYMFDPKYVLRDLEEVFEVALDGKGGPVNIDLEPYVTFVCDWPANCTLAARLMEIVGLVHYVGLGADMPLFYLDIEKVQQS